MPLIGWIIEYKMKFIVFRFYVKKKDVKKTIELEIDKFLI